MKTAINDTSHGPVPPEPMRTCIGCREREPRSLLVRVVLNGDHVVVDHTGTAPGRGAWLHPSGECLATAVKRRAFNRALRAERADASGLQSEHLRLR